jgi:hypothetical protein
VDALKDRERQRADVSARLEHLDGLPATRMYTVRGRANYGRILDGIIRVGGLVPPGGSEGPYTVSFSTRVPAA